jgi:hypothetical protein
MLNLFGARLHPALGLLVAAVLVTAAVLVSDVMLGAVAVVVLLATASRRFGWRHVHIDR